MGSMLVQQWTHFLGKGSNVGSEIDPFQERGAMLLRNFGPEQEMGSMLLRKTAIS